AYLIDSNSPTAIVTILEHGLPLVTITATDEIARESTTDGAIFTVTRVSSLPTNLKANFKLEGTPLNGLDYVSVQGTITIPAGLATASIAITPLNDLLIEHDESVVAT